MSEGINKRYSCACSGTEKIGVVRCTAPPPSNRVASAVGIYPPSIVGEITGFAEEAGRVQDSRQVRQSSLPLLIISLIYLERTDLHSHAEKKDWINRSGTRSRSMCRGRDLV